MSDPQAPAPSHGHPASDIPSTRDKTESRATGDHPSANAPDPTLSSSQPHNTDSSNARTGQLSTAATTGSTKLADLKVNLRNALRQYPDFPSPGILFEDIMPIFASPSHHRDLITALELQITTAFTSASSASTGHGIDVIVGLESRGFLFGPTLALNLGAGFVPVRKQGKLPGPTVTEGYKKEYGEDFFQVQRDAIAPGQRVVVVDDIIATGGSAAAAGNLVKQLGGVLVGYVFLMELDFLKGRDKLDAPVHTLLSGQEEALKSS